MLGSRGFRSTHGKDKIAMNRIYKILRIVCGNASRNVAIFAGLIDPPDILVRFTNTHPLPEDVEFGVMHVVASGNRWKWAYFRCPSKYEEIIQLCLMTDYFPSWKLSVDFLLRPTLTPSVRQVSGSYAHFFVHCGKIQYCRDTGIPIKWKQEKEAVEYDDELKQFNDLTRD